MQTHSHHKDKKKQNKSKLTKDEDEIAEGGEVGGAKSYLKKHMNTLKSISDQDNEEVSEP